MARCFTGMAAIIFLIEKFRVYNSTMHSYFVLQTMNLMSIFQWRIVVYSAGYCFNGMVATDISMIVVGVMINSIFIFVRGY
jgi:hypothetical protein